MTPAAWVAPGGDLVVRASTGRLLHVRPSRHPRARHLRLSVGAEGAWLTWPRGVPERRALAFLAESRPWLETRLAALERQGAGRGPLRVGVADVLPLRGAETRLEWREASAPHADWHGARLVLCLPRPWDARRLPLARQLLRDVLEEAVRRELARALPRLAAALGRAPAGVRIRRMSRQWGSLGVRDHVHLDLTLALAPPPALRYVLAHELAHLLQRNHSPRFWREVERLDPAWCTQRDWLREHGGALRREMLRLLGPRR